MKTALIAIVCLLFGMTWNVDWDRPYYEAQGHVSIHQRLLGVEFLYTWNDFGRNHHREWDIYRKERPHFNRTPEHPG